MSYVTNQLISGSYYASGVVSREFETVSGEQISDGLQWLNDILTETNSNESMVPYESTYNFNAVTGQEKYFIPNLVEVDTLVFFLQTVRYEMKYTKRNQYFGSSRVENIQTLPFSWYFERGFGGGTLYIYFEPNQNYPMELHGTFMLQPVILGQDLSLTYDQVYRTYLRYALAARICDEYNYVVPPGVEKNLDKYIGLINKKSKNLDLQIHKVSTLTRRGHMGWAYINLGRGFVASY